MVICGKRFHNVFESCKNRYSQAILSWPVSHPTSSATEMWDPGWQA